MYLKFQVGDFRRENDRINLRNMRYEMVDGNISTNKKSGGP